MNGKVIVIVAPSGTGKSTLIKRLLNSFEKIKWSVSTTTRPMRTGEVNGKDYHFVSEEDFKKKIKAEDFVEWALVHSNYYGTSKSALEVEIAKGNYVLCDVDVQGTDSIKKIFGEQAIAIFIEPPSLAELKKRLEVRGTDSKEVIAERIKNAEAELTRKNDFDHLVMNDDIEKAYQKLHQIFKEVVG